jgi:hypothetical protein
MIVIAAATAALTVGIYGFLGVTAVRRPLLALIAYRQVVRRPGQSALMVVGMMFASAAILGTATVADSLQASSDDMIVRSWGRVDLTVTNSSRPFPASVADRLARDPRVRPGPDRCGG